MLKISEGLVIEKYTYYGHLKQKKQAMQIKIKQSNNFGNFSELFNLEGFSLHTPYHYIEQL